MGKLQQALKSFSQVLGGRKEHNNADEVFIENNLNINGAAFAGASLQSMTLYVDHTGAVIGGIATLKDGTSITITVKLLEVK